MNMKIYFEQEIYRIPELPSTFEQLNEVVSSKFKDSLPKSWSLYASDNEGNQSLISNNIEYLNLLKVDPQSSPQTVKIHIQAVKILEVPAEKEVQENEVVSQAQPMEIDAESMRNILISEAATSDYHFKHDFEKKSMKKAKHIIKKIGKIKRSEKRAFLLEKLQRIEYWLTPEQKEELQRKKDKYEISKISQDLPLDHHRHRHGHGHWRHHDDDSHGHFHGRHHHHGHHHGHHRGYHGHRHHRGHGSRSSSRSSSSSSSRSSSHDRHHHHGKRFHKKHHKFAEKLQKFMFISRGPVMGETNQISKQGESLEGQFNKICIDSQQGKTVQQHNVRCNGCGAESITGIRYKCSECPQFNFCEVCEALENHPHAFLKLRTPEAEAMNRIFIADNLWKKAKKEKPHRIFKAFKTFKKMAKAQKKGDMKKFNKCHDKLFGKFAEEAKRLLNGACEWRPANRQQIEEEWLRLNQMSLKSIKPINMDLAAREEQDNIERYVDEQLSRLAISD